MDMHDLTLEDIARMAGVSPSTVSRVLNNLVGTRSKAREQVLKVLAETGFQPNAAARSLASQRSHVIGLLIPAPASTILHNPTVLQLAEVVSQACHERDYLLSLFLLGSDTGERLIHPSSRRPTHLRRPSGICGEVNPAQIPDILDWVSDSGSCWKHASGMTGGSISSSV